MSAASARRDAAKGETAEIRCGECVYAVRIVTVQGSLYGHGLYVARWVQRDVERETGPCTSVGAAKMHARSMMRQIAGQS